MFSNGRILLPYLKIKIKRNYYSINNYWRCMTRPKFITNEDITRWSNNIDQDPYISTAMRENETIREVCYAGLFLIEELEKLKCPNSLINRIQYTAGKLSFGRDIWEVHQDILEKYKNNELIFEEENNSLN